MELLSLFSGCGGLDLGFHQSGYKTILACDFDKKILPTFQFNFPDTPTFWDGIEKLNTDHIKNLDGLIGGPPCQSWSLGGAQKGILDPRGKLFYEYIKILKKLQPKFFLAENVRGILAPKHNIARENIIALMQEAGYCVQYFLLNAVNYSVPQDRERVFFIGYRNDLNKTPTLPPIHKIKLNLKDALKNLKEPVSTQSINIDKKKQHEYLVSNWSPHFFSRNRVRNFSEPSFTTITFTRAIPLHPKAPKMLKMKKDKWVFNPDHLDLYRRFSVREYARIQTFPDDFKFIYEKIDLGYKMIGNAVPVNLSKAWADHIKNEIFK